MPRWRPATVTLVPADALATLAEQLRADESVISPCVRDPEAAPHLGELAAAGPGAAADPAAFSLVVESVREGYLLHYGEPRVLATDDRDLRLLAGDYMYALGLERLAGLGDLPAVRELADLIALSAELHADGQEAGRELADTLWVASVVAIAAGDYERLAPAKEALRAADPAAKGALDEAADEIAASVGLGARLARVRAGIDFRAVRPT
jgi:hypothetical protein